MQNGKKEEWGFERPVFSRNLNDLARSRVINPRIIVNRLQRITMLDMRQMDMLIPFFLFPIKISVVVAVMVVYLILKDFK